MTNKKSTAKRFKKNRKKPEEASEIEYVAQDFLEPNQPEQCSSEEEELDTQKLVIEQRKKKSKSGGFQSMGFSYPVLKGVLKKGYRIPTPIQRKTIPLILQGKDVLAMARTGSGKTAAFLLPLFEKLKVHKAQSGARAVILSPTRELALQTYKFIKELGKFTDLKSALVLGGDNMEKQFSALHQNPDIIIATPGRLLHVMVEMNLKLNLVEYAVFDEADRLFEMGFKEQLNEILHRLSVHRQTLLFSATLPQTLIEFSKAGLTDPVFIRLDTETKLSENLRTIFLNCREDDKVAILLNLIKSQIRPQEMTVVFVPTRHHVEYLKDIFMLSGVQCTYLYSSLDQEARKLSISQFLAKKVKLMLVTDVAARGVDIPMLDNVINFNFPDKPKLFIHRVGRVARAGRSGRAYSLVNTDEAPFVHSLHLFLGRPIILAKREMDSDEDGIFGTIPQANIDEEMENLNRWHQSSVDLHNMKKVCNNAFKQYVKSRASPASESVKQIRELMKSEVHSHPIFNVSKEVCNDNFMSSLKNYKPTTTIFEIGNTKNNMPFEVMKSKRKVFDKIIDKQSKKETTSFVLNGEKFKDEQFYLNYKSDSYHTEKGFEMEKSFAADVADASFDIDGDDTEAFKKSKSLLKWDRKKKKFVGVQNSGEEKKKKIKTESGNYISASYKTDLYKKWKEKSKIEKQESDEEVDVEVMKRDRELGKRKGKHQPIKKELKNKEQIFKERQKQEKKQAYQRWKTNERAKRKGKGNQKELNRGKKFGNKFSSKKRRR